jgi:flagellar hook-associated protein 1 FlgK
MADMLSSGVSGLIAFQRALDTTSHNIANASTDGYSRQQVQLVSNPADLTGAGWVGTGVNIDTVRRLYDTAVAGQANTASSGFQQLDTFATYAARVDNLFSDTTTGLSTTLQNFMNAVQAVADSPADVSSRQVLLSQAQTLTDRLKGFDSSLRSMDSQVTTQLGSEATTVSTLAQNIASLNQQIVIARGSTGQPPNDLMDQRDKLIKDLATHVSTSTVVQSDGAINVFIGSGQAIVMGTAAAKLSVAGDQYGRGGARLLLSTGSTPADVTAVISGGTIGGLLQFRSQLLQPAANAVGQAAVTLATLVNQQQAAGLDLQGQVGTAIFGVGGVNVLPSNLNAGSGTLAVTRSGTGALTTADYQLEYSGGAWQMTRTDTGAVVALSGAGTALSPLTADGLAIVVGGTPQQGDRFLVQPTAIATNGMQVVMTQPEKVAAAAPLLTSANATNSGTGSIDAGSVPSTASWVRGNYTLSFNPANTWQATDAAGNAVASGAYTPGAPIAFNGVQVTVSGAPAAGDSFLVKDNAGGTGDNRNALKIAALLNSPVLGGGTVSLNDAVGRLIGNVGVQTNQAQTGRDAQQIVLSDANSAMSNVSGVNLDEEAANLIRYQQAYQAAAKVIGVANSLFQTLLDATK